MSVAHVTDGNMEIVQPLKTTATHVIVTITHLSLFGLIRDVFSFLPVRSQVLLFLQPQGNRPQKRILNVMLLPKNVPLCEVIFTVSINSFCTLQELFGRLNKSSYSAFRKDSHPMPFLHFVVTA